jgi:integrase
MQTTTLQPSTVLQLHWLDQFQAYLQTEHRKATRRQLSRKSITLAVQHARVFGLWYEAQFNQAFEPHTITNYDLNLYRAISLEKEKVMAATWNSRLWALGLICVYIGSPELMDGIEQKQQVRASTKHRSLTSDEYHRLVHTIEQDTRRALTIFENQTAIRNRAAVILMLHGLRVEEVSLLTADDITINERSGNVLVRNGKGSKERNVPLNLLARQALASYLNLTTGSTTLFNLSTRTLQRIVAELGARINVPDLTPHWLRYTCGKRLEANNTPIETIRDILGHNSIETTRRYLRSSMEDLQSAMEGVM